MSYRRFVQIQRHLFFADTVEDLENHPGMSEDAAAVRSLIKHFNMNRRATIECGGTLSMDELMSAWRGSRRLGVHIQYVQRKPEPWGIELKTVLSGDADIILVLEMQLSAEEMCTLPHATSWHGKKPACVRRMLETGRLLGANRLVGGDSWFCSLKTAVMLGQQGTFYVGPMKTDTAGYPAREGHSHAMANLEIGDHTVWAAHVTADGKPPVTCYAVFYKAGTSTVWKYLATAGTSLPEEGRVVPLNNGSTMSIPRPNFVYMWDSLQSNTDLVSANPP
jgi:hypothetical protein